MTIFNATHDELTALRDKYGILSASADLLSFGIVLDTMPKITHMLELGTYIGGGLLFFNDFLKQKAINVQFTAVDQLTWAVGFKNFIWHHHGVKSLTTQNLEDIARIGSTDDAVSWLQKRCLETTGHSIDLRWFINEHALDQQQYDIVFHDYGKSVEDNTATMELCIPKLNDTGIYVIDDFEPAQPYRVIATVNAMQQGKLFPVLWGERKVYFARTVEYAQEFTKLLAANPNLNTKLFAPYADYTHSGVTYNPLRLHVSPLRRFPF